MENETKKSEGPTCACGKTDLYEEWLKSNEKNKTEASDTTASNQEEKINDSADSDVKEDHLKAETA